MHVTALLIHGLAVYDGLLKMVARTRVGLELSCCKYLLLHLAAAVQSRTRNITAAITFGNSN